MREDLRLAITTRHDFSIRTQRVRADPLNLNGWYMADQSSIRYYDEANDVVTLVAGSDELGTANGIGAAARFFGIASLLITSDGKQMWCGQSEGALRQIDTSTHEVSNCWREAVHSLVWIAHHHHRQTRRRAILHFFV